MVWLVWDVMLLSRKMFVMNALSCAVLLLDVDTRPVSKVLWL